MPTVKYNFLAMEMFLNHLKGKILIMRVLETVGATM